MINWKFDASQFNPDRIFDPIPVGDHRVRVEEAEEQVSKTGRDMIKLTLSVSGHDSKLFHYIVFMHEHQEMTNQSLGMFFDSFGIRPGDMNLQNWIGKVGAARVKHETYEGRTNARVSFFILRSKQGDLPLWQERGARAPKSLREEFAESSEEPWRNF